MSEGNLTVHEFVQLCTIIFTDCCLETRHWSSQNQLQLQRTEAQICLCDRRGDSNSYKGEEIDILIKFIIKKKEQTCQVLLDCITVEYGEICIQVIKLDVETKLQVEWSAENCWPSEPVFVPRPGASEEHDGELFKNHDFSHSCQYSVKQAWKSHQIGMDWLWVLLTCSCLLTMFRRSPNYSHKR